MDRLEDERGANENVDVHGTCDVTTQTEFGSSTCVHVPYVVPANVGSVFLLR